MRVRLAIRDWAYHGSHSGYERLADWLGDASVIRRRYVPYRIAKTIAGWAHHDRYTSLSFQLEFASAIDMVVHRPDIIHFLYGEHDYHFLGYLKRFVHNTRLVATFHHPPEELERRLGPSGKGFLRALGGAICVGTNQVSYLETWIGQGRVHWVPHGIDREFFCPDGSERDDKHLLIVGVSHRDLFTLHQALEVLKTRVPELRCTAVIQSASRGILSQLRWINFLDKIDDVTLLSLYRRATCTLLILRDCTASNTLLEAISTGCPLVVTDIGGVRDYVDGSCALLVRPSSVRDVVNATETLLRPNHVARELSVSERERSEAFDWRKVAKDTVRVYEAVMAEGTS